ncbi:MerR family transcriptional regulator [Nocardia sp. ET3-3]|uniref:MerR family transcriptional regulator n=1 Tax=Nocardia terrae TaxID=2675851 RepID=A0A7K1UVS5_9NOCA|nr:MerR family transcriptional regulator [Nocardia terrae]
MQIGELSHRTGVSVRALRYYEEKGALTPRRTPAGYRIFDDAAIDTVAHIQTLLAAGLGMDLIADILACAAGDGPLLDGCRDRLLRERERMTTDIDRIRSARSMLDQLLDPDGPVVRPEAPSRPA